MKICFINTASPPDFLGGSSLFHRNLVTYLRSNHKEIDITWLYFGDEKEEYIKDGVKYIKLKSPKSYSPFSLRKNLALSGFFKENFFDIINTLEDPWLYFYKKRDQGIVRAYHGTMFSFYKNYYGRFGWMKKIFLTLFLIVCWLSEVPNKKVDKFICVSEKVKRQVEKLYGEKNNIAVVRTGVDVRNFKPRDKSETKKRLGLDKTKTYGLYVGRGGYWTKGLDRVINLSEEIYKKNKNYRLLVVGADEEKVKHLLKKEFTILLPPQTRDKLPDYYNSAEVFFCLSRCEGGAPTLVTSEAMASGCFVVCSKDSEQEIIKDKENGLIVERFDEKDAEEILSIINNRKEKEKIIKNSMKTIKELSLEKWGERYFKEMSVIHSKPMEVYNR